MQLIRLAALCSAALLPAVCAVQSSQEDAAGIALPRAEQLAHLGVYARGPDELARRATSKSSTVSSIKSASKTSSIVTSTKPATPSCPAIWTTVAADLKVDFANCSQTASNAIRFSFHDAIGYSSKTKAYGPASGGADGSLLLNDTEALRSEHNPMQGYRRYLLDKYTTYHAKGVGAADLVQFAGNLGVASCPGGPIVKTVVGRKDDATAAPTGMIPAAFGAGSAYAVLIQLFADKGLEPRELAALMGAHTASRAFIQTSRGIPANGPQDSTPEVWDNTYYSQTQAKDAPEGVYRFDSDVNLANSSTVSGKAYTEFARDKTSWGTAFTAAMYKMSNLGLSQATISGFADCTAVIRTNASP